METDTALFAGKKALVVGGSGGIGAALSRLLAASGADLTVHGGSANPRFDALLADLAACRPQSLVQRFSPETFAELASSPVARAAAGSDILCVCYGPFIQKPLDAMSLQDWQAAALLDYALPGFLVSRALPGMKERGWGRILLFGGTGTESRREFLTNAAYAGAKTAVGTLVQSVAASYAPYGITCNALLPGFTQTEYTETVSGPGGAAALARKMPGGRLISAQSAARAAFFLLQQPDINGALLRCDRGWSPLCPSL